MLNDNLFKITSLAHEDGKIVADISIDIQHHIFEGHFPGQPVLPGVCMIQIAKELMEKALNQKLLLQEAAQCKFVSMVDPVQNSQLSVLIEYGKNNGNISTNTQLKSGATIFFKMKADFIPFPS